MLECEHRKDLHWILTPGGFQQSFRVWKRCPGCLEHRMGIAESTRDACFYQSSFTIIYTMKLHFMRKKVLHLKFFKQPTYFNFSVSETKQYEWRYSIGPEALRWNPDLHSSPELSHYHHIPLIPVQQRTTAIRNAEIISAECRKGDQLSITKDYTFKDVKSYLSLTIIRTFNKENKTNILRNIKELTRRFKKMK